MKTAAIPDWGSVPRAKSKPCCYRKPDWGTRGYQRSISTGGAPHTSVSGTTASLANWTLLAFTILVAAELAEGTPNICTVVNTPQFTSCLDLSIKPSTCGFPPRPCVHLAYYVPSYYIEVVANPAETYFAALPAAASQLASINDRLPVGTEEDHGSYSYHAHSLTVPSVSVFNALPCGGVPIETACLGAMSEHLGRKWKTGEADAWQPQHLLWVASPKSCLVSGAATSAAGGSPPSGYPHYPSCSFDRSSVARYGPSLEPACNGWGVFYPRNQTTVASDQTTAALMIAARFKSLSSEVFNSMPSGGDEKYQMIYPQPTLCFRQGENIARLRLKMVNEAGRGINTFSKNYLFAIWRKVQCTKDIYHKLSTPLTVSAIKTACRAIN